MSTQENLEERIERIRKRNEEIQKRHAEAEADKLQAKKENAMVVTKIRSDFEDWPREHKYDKVDFTFDVDVNNQHCDERLIDQKDRKPDRVRKSQGFAEGDGPPPDPTYSFLKDAERDGGQQRQSRNQNYDENQHWGPRDSTQVNQRGGRGRGGRGGRGRGNPRGGSGGPRNNSHPEYDAWRSERNKIDEARINRQKNSEGKWRREWDNEKFNAENEINHAYKPEKPTMGDIFQGNNIRKSYGNRENLNDHNNHINGEHEKKMDGRERPNITVCVNHSGEVQSVKVTSPPVIGSGRVGPRQMKPRPIFPSEDESDDSHASQIQNHPHRPKLQHQQKQQNNSPNHNRNQQSPQSYNRQNNQQQSPPNHNRQHMQKQSPSRHNGQQKQQNTANENEQYMRSPPRHNGQQQNHNDEQNSSNGTLENVNMHQTKQTSSLQDRLNRFRVVEEVTDGLDGIKSLNDLKQLKPEPTFVNIKKELEDVTAEIQGIYNSVENLNKKHTFEESIETEIEQLEKCSKTNLDISNNENNIVTEKKDTLIHKSIEGGKNTVTPEV